MVRIFDSFMTQTLMAIWIIISYIILILLWTVEENQLVVLGFLSIETLKFFDKNNHNVSKISKQIKKTWNRLGDKKLS